METKEGSESKCQALELSSPTYPCQCPFTENCIFCFVITLSRYVNDRAVVVILANPAADKQRNDLLVKEEADFGSPVAPVAYKIDSYGGMKVGYVS